MAAKTCARCKGSASVCVCSYTRGAGRRRKKRKPAARKAPTGTYYVCESDAGRTCGTHHRTFTAATKHAQVMRRKDRERRAYFSGGVRAGRSTGRKKLPKLPVWYVAKKGG